MLDELYEEAKVITTEKLSELPGRITMGIDGHKMGKRHVETLTRAKLGVSTFQHAELLATKRATGKVLCELVSKYIDGTVIAVVADNTGNNTGNRTGLFALLRARTPTLLCIGCCVHVLDLVIEDVAKMEYVSAAANMAHFVTTFVKKHALVYEEFLQCQKLLKVKLELVVFPLTRFAYAHLMCMRVVKNFSVLRLLSESDSFAAVKAQVSKRGRQGEKSLVEFQRFEDLVGSRDARTKILGAAMLLEPFSTVLHYLEGDSVPVSHVYPCYQLLYDFVQQLGKVSQISALLEDEDEQDKVCSIVRDRWLGAARKTGLKDQLHFCAFALDPYAQAALTTANSPECDLLTQEVSEAARQVFKYIETNPIKRAMLIEQFGLWCAARPRLSVGTRCSEATQSGNNSFSSLYLTGMQLVWDKMKSASSEQVDQPTYCILDAIKHTIANLKTCSKPTEFWLAMSAEIPRGASQSAIEAHRYFCRIACDLLAIVSHTAGVERAGKGYGLILTSLRQSMDPERVRKCVYCLENYGLLSLGQEAGGGLEAFERSYSNGADVAEHPLRDILPRGNLIVDDAPGSDLSSEDTDNSGEEDDEDIDAVSWGLPRGFEIMNKPGQIDEACVGCFVFLNWEKFGWQLGKITELITLATPRLFQQFNVRVSWADGRGPCKLDLDMYLHGESAPCNAWVLLKQCGSRGDGDESED